MKKRLSAGLLSAFFCLSTFLSAAPGPFSPALTASAEELPSNDREYDISGGIVQPGLIWLSDEEISKLHPLTLGNSEEDYSVLPEDPPALGDFASVTGDDHDLSAAESVFDRYDFSTDYYYNQLDGSKKELWDEFEAISEDVFNNDKDYENGRLDVGVLLDYPDELSYDEAYYTYLLFCYSNPKYFFLAISLYVGYTDNNELVYVMGLMDEFQTAAERRKCKEAIAELTEDWMTGINAVDGDLAKEEYIISKLSDHAEYGDPAAPIPGQDLSYMSQTIASALYYKKTVCAGYAAAMVYFCNAAGIDCIMAVSNDHAWNIVKLDGVWYEVDVTNYDRNGNALIFLNRKHSSIMQRLDNDSYVYNESFYEAIELPECNTDLYKYADRVSIGELSGKTTYVYVGDTIRPEFTIIPSDADPRSIYFYSYNPDVARVSSDGTVTGVSFGVTFIGAVAAWTNKAEFFWVYVFEHSEPNEKIKLCTGETFLLDPDLSMYGEVSNIGVETLDPDICEIGDDGLTAKKSGTAVFVLYFDVDGQTVTTPYIVEIDITGHDWGDWELATPSTCVLEGQEVRTCKRDPNHKEYRKAALLAHQLTQAYETIAHPVGDLTWCRGRIGNVEADWSIEGDDFMLTVSIPAHSAATILLPYSRQATVVGEGTHNFKERIE